MRLANYLLMGAFLSLSLQAESVVFFNPGASGSVSYDHSTGNFVGNMTIATVDRSNIQATNKTCVGCTLQFSLAAAYNAGSQTYTANGGTYSIAGSINPPGGAGSPIISGALGTGTVSVNPGGIVFFSTSAAPLANSISNPYFLAVLQSFGLPTTDPYTGSLFFAAATFAFNSANGDISNGIFTSGNLTLSPTPEPAALLFSVFGLGLLLAARLTRTSANKLS